MMLDWPARVLVALLLGYAAISIVWLVRDTIRDAMRERRDPGCGERRRREVHRRAAWRARAANDNK